MNLRLVTLLVASSAPLACGFSQALFQEAPTLQRTTPSTIEGVDIELPDFNELFDRIQRISPLARQVISRENEQRGLEYVDNSWPEDLKWKRVEASKRNVIQSIEKIDNFQGKNAPLLRFRASLKGPCIGEPFGNYIMQLEEREKWDAQISQVYEVAPIYDLDAANIAMGFGRYGDCSRLGVGYCQTKANMGISPREQLTLCALQEFPNKSCIIWGTEMQERHNYLFPEGKRFVRAKSHIFATTLTPTGPDNFDVEYVLQLESGGNLPNFLTTPVMIDTIKSLFRTAAKFYDGSDELKAFLAEKNGQTDEIEQRHSLLMTP